MSNNIFDLLRTDLPTKKASAPKVAPPKAFPKTSTAVAPKSKAAAPAKNATSAPKKDATFNPERALKEDNKRQGEKKIRAPRGDRNTDFTWKEGDDKPAVKSNNPEKQIRAIAGNNRRERRAFEAKVSEAGDVAPQKRQFDRRSAHPAGEVKKGGFGKGNWGTPGSEVEGDNKEKRERRPRGEKRERRPREGEEKKEFVPRELTEEEKLEQAEREADAKLLTLGQYKKKIAAEKVKIELPKARQAGEGVADQWSEYSVLEKQVDTEKPAKKAVEAAAPGKVDEALVAHSQAVLKKKQAEKKILSDLLKGRTPNNGQRRDNRRGEQKQAAAQEFGLVEDEFPTL